MKIKKEWVSWEEFRAFLAGSGSWTPAAHTHLKSDITDTPWAWTDVLKTGSNLTDLATRQHAGLSDAPADAHHAQLHAAAHLVGAGDALSIGSPVNIGTSNSPGSATNFVRRDHVHNHPSGLGADLHHAASHTLASHSTKAHSELSDAPVDAHHARDHASRHQSGGADTIKLDDLATPDDNTDLNATVDRHGLLRKLVDDTELFLRSDGAWEIPLADPTLHATTHELAGSDEVHHDLLKGFVLNEHKDHTVVFMTAGSGLSGGGNISATRTFDLGLLTADWDAGSYQIRALKFYADQATGTAPFTVLSTTKVGNLNVDRCDDKHVAEASTVSTIVARNSSGDINVRLVRSEYDTTNPTCNYIMTQIDTASDNYVRPSTKAQLISSLALMLTTGGTFSGAVYARNHGTAAVDEIVNVCYGTGSPPAASGVTIGTIFLKYVV